MKSLDEFEKTLEQFAADWPADGSIVDRVVHGVKSTHLRENPTPILPGLSTMQRLVVGSVGLSAIVALVLAILSFGSTNQLSAMERMVEKMRDVTSFRYAIVIRDTIIREGAEEPVTVESNGMVWCQLPSSFREEMLIFEYDPKSSPSKRKRKQLSRFQVVHPTGKPGVIINRLAKTILWLPEFQGEFPEYSPVTKLQMVREKSGEMLRDLGSKTIDASQRAQGFVMKLEGAAEGSGFDALEVWVDPETDLPIEFSYVRQTESGKQSYRLFDCRWNIDLEPQLFETDVPDSYTDTTPPEGEKPLNQIIEALRLYAQLSDGKYPLEKPLDATAVKKEMLHMAGLAGIRHDEITTQGLEWMAKILLNRTNAGYHGDKVGPSDHDKILLWWSVKAEHSYRVVYGDLRTEVLEGDRRDQLHKVSFGDSKH